MGALMINMLKIKNKILSQYLWIVILPHLRCRFDKPICLRRIGDFKVFEVNYIASLCHQSRITSFELFLFGASLHDDACQKLIPNCVVLEKGLFIDQFLDLFNADHANPLDVYGSILG